MLQRLIICGLLLYMATILDQGLPVWFASPVQPSLLSLIFILFCQSLQGAELVIWSGGVGLALDFLAGDIPGPAVMTLATLGLLAGWFLPASFVLRTLLDRLLGGLWLLLGLTVIQGIGMAFRTTTASLEEIATTLVTRLAATYLLVVVVNLLWYGARYCRRSNYHQLENSCV